jgi:serine/threonine-protein kinase
MDTPMRLGRYILLRHLGTGGMGAVYLALQIDLQRHVAIKVLADGLMGDARALAQLREEALAAARVSSDHVVRMYEFGFSGRTPFIAMEYVDGCSRSALLSRRRFTPHEATQVVVAVLRGLHAIHEAGVLHLDVKPGNILMARDGRVKLGDFGIARRNPRRSIASLVTGILSAKTLVGSPPYMAPEQAEGRLPDRRTDLYAVGVTLYLLMTGRLPLGVEPVAFTRITKPRELVPELPDALEVACLTLMARDPASRPGSAAEAIQLLEDATRLVRPES